MPWNAVIAEGTTLSPLAVRALSGEATWLVKKQTPPLWLSFGRDPDP